MKVARLIIGMLLPLSLAAQSPWARSKAGFFVQASWNTIPAYTTLFGASGSDLSLSRKVSESSVQLYGEYGISSKTTLAATLPVVFNRRGELNPKSNLSNPGNEGRIGGLGNAAIALRRQFLSGKTAMAGTLKVSLPAGAKAEENGLRTGYDAFTLLPMLSLGQGYRDFYWYAYGGYGFRSNDYSSFLNAGAELGIKAGKLTLAGFSDLVYPLKDETLALPPVEEFTGLYMDQQGWASIGVKAALSINRFVGVHVYGAGAAWAKFVPKSPAVGAGIYFKWD